MCLLSLFILVIMPTTTAYYQPLLEVEVSGYFLTAGDENEIWISITNVGRETAYDVKASLTIPQTVLGIAVINESYLIFDTIGIGETKRMHPILYVASSCQLGAYSLAFTLEYYDWGGKKYTDSVQIGVVVDAIRPIKLAIDVDVDDYHVAAGSEKEINITTTNIGEEAVYDVKAALASTSPGIVVLKEPSYLFDKVEVGERVNFRPLLGVSRSVALGAYSLTLTLTYEDSKGVTYRDSVAVGIFVASVLSPRLAFVATVEGYRVRAGAENEIKVVITNTGDTSVYDVDAQLSSASPNIVVLKEMGRTFDVIKPNSSVYFMPTLGVSRSAPLGAYSLTLTLKYKDPDGVSYTDSLIMGVFVDSVEPTYRTTITVQDFQITPLDVHPGDKLTVEMELKNLGADAYDVQVQLITDPQSPLVSLSPTLIFVGDLGSNHTTKIIYGLQISGDAKAQPYTLQLTILYYDVYGQPNNIAETMSIGVRSIASFRLLNVQPSNLTVEPGEMVLTEADLLLIGTETVKFAQIEIVGNYPFISTSESYEYIGRIDPDSPVPFDIQFMVDPNATAGSYTLQMRVSYWDEYNQERQAIRELPVIIKESVQKEEEVSLTFWDTIRIIIRFLLGVKP